MSPPARYRARSKSAGRFTGREVVTGTVGGRPGGFVLAERGTFDHEPEDRSNRP
ncbi:DUF3224 family protein [Streptomyces sp. TRM43335]|uniref:DUF3224 family protein n=1 Tax=Streptomyces taklimakanensis TaxID=2569853 RepID=A0A6G2BJ69_9ACTN|nr:DUF3224 family protein [Streptomyces taklimakanensis]